MRTISRTIAALGLLATIVACPLIAQEPPRSRDRPAQRPKGDDLVTRMMAFDKDDDGALKKAEVTDARLLRLFDRADANKDGSVTREELATLVSQEPPMPRGGPPGGGPGGFPRPGEILPRPVQDRLELTADQKSQLAELQREVDTRLEKILNDEQRTQLKAMRSRGPGFGPGIGPGGPGRGGRPGPGGPR